LTDQSTNWHVIVGWFQMLLWERILNKCHALHLHHMGRWSKCCLRRCSR